MPLGLLLTLALAAAAPEAALESARAMAARGDLPAALARHEAVLRFGSFPSAGGWFNHAKLLQRAGRLPEALFAYRQGLRQTATPPPEVWGNLRQVRRELRGDPPPTGPLATWDTSVQFTEANSDLFFVAVWLTTVAAFCFGLFAARRWKWWTALALAAVALIGNGWLLAAHLRHGPDRPEDRSQLFVVLREPATLRQGNGASYPPSRRGGEAALLKAGDEGWLLARRPNGWLKLELADGTQGWLPEGKALVELNPAP